MSSIDLIRGIVFAVFVSGMTPVFRRVWASRKARVVTPILKYERLEVGAILAFVIVAGIGVALIAFGFLRLGASVVVGSLSALPVVIYAHIRRKLSGS